MTTSFSKTYNEILEELKQKILKIGGGELELWKLSVLSDEMLFKQLYELIYSEEEKVAWRSGWIIDNAAEDHHEMLAAFIPDIVAQLLITKNSSLKRIFTRILIRYEIPDELLGSVLDRCYQLLSPLEPVAVRANAMQVIYNITQLEPALKQEFLIVLRDLLEEGGTAGLVNRASKLIKAIESTDSLKHQKKQLKLHPIPK